MASVARWTGREAKALRRALRQSIRDFAANLGIGVRTVTKWEALGADTTPRPVIQAVSTPRWPRPTRTPSCASSCF